VLLCDGAVLGVVAVLFGDDGLVELPRVAAYAPPAPATARTAAVTPTAALRPSMVGLLSLGSPGIVADPPKDPLRKL
jgi:hypothetical protein